MNITENIITGDYTPIERIILTCQGNVQQVLSAFFNSQINVKIINHQNLHSNATTDNQIINHPNSYTRKVKIYAGDEMISVAESEIIVYDPLVGELLEKSGIGQMFQSMGVKPHFEMMEYGKSVNGGLFRTYVLKTRQVECKITENYHPNIFNL